MHRPDSGTPVIQLKNISKSFGPVKANNNLSLDIREGEIHALLGENGSGKSTLVNILSGIYSPDEGEIFFEGKKVSMNSPKKAIDLGIGMVHQHFKLAEVLSARQNISAGRRESDADILNKLDDIAKKYNLSVDPDKKIYDMSVSEKQTVEIIKVLSRGARILILDEPTAVLTPQEIRSLFEILGKMKADGCSVVLITHKLSEVMEISDRVTVMRKGECIGSVNTSETSPRELTEMMVGRALELGLVRTPATRSEQPLLAARGLTLAGPSGKKLVDDISFELYGGEILGVAGIAGSGQKELCEIIAGIQKADGSILYEQREILGKNPREIARLGIGMSFIPEDRLGMGLVPDMDIVENVMLKTYASGKGVFVDRTEGTRLAKKIVDRFEIATPDVNYTVKNLSGGNIQKVLLGREVEADPKILITAYPVRGLDIGASYRIYDILGEQKAKGVGVMFIGEDLDVLLGLCDRLAVIHDGKLMAVLDPKTVTKDRVGLLMMGMDQSEEDTPCA